MKKTKEKKYSKEPFDDYKYRARIRIVVVEVKNHEVVKREIDTDIYTTEGNTEKVKNYLFSRCAENVVDLTITWWATREQDDAAAELIEEFLSK